jgi:membrane protein YqaA with SNARE-associated domain
VITWTKRIFLKTTRNTETHKIVRNIIVRKKLKMKRWLRKLHTWSLQWADTKWGTLALFLCAFADASFLGLPTPMLFIALVILNKVKAYRFVLTGISGTIAGALAGYAIGHFAWLNNNGEFTGFAMFLFDNIPGFSLNSYESIQQLYEKWDIAILFVAAALPLPFKIFSISSGVFDVNLLVFSGATLISQAIKFYLLALLTIKLGPEVKNLLKLNWKPIAMITTVGIAAAIILIIIL